jgi:TIGR03009 family protein
MRRSWLALAVLLVLGALAYGQQPQAPAAPAAASTRLDEILRQWEARMKSIDSLAAEVVRDKEDRQFRIKERYIGVAKYMKPDLASLDLHNEKRPDVRETFICTGTSIYEFNPSGKEIRIHDLPPPRPGQVADDNFLAFLFGMKADEARKRYDMALFQEEDANYIKFRILPRFPADKADFQVAYLALLKSNLLPRTIMFVEPNGNQTRWDFPVVEIGARVNRQEFVAPALPKGWRYVRVPRADAGAPQGFDPPPRVVRPKQ